MFKILIHIVLLRQWNSNAERLLLAESESPADFRIPVFANIASIPANGDYE